MSVYSEIKEIYNDANKINNDRYATAKIIKILKVIVFFIVCMVICLQYLNNEMYFERINKFLIYGELQQIVINEKELTKYVAVFLGTSIIYNVFLRYQ